MARNLGGSIGVSVAATMLARGMQVHQAYLTDHLAPSSPSFQMAIQDATGALQAQGLAPADAAHGALALIGRTVMEQAALLAYVDIFAGYALLAAVLVPIAFMLRPADQTSSVAVH